MDLIQLRMISDKHESIIESTVEFVKAELQDAEAGHDWFHILRVWKNAITLAKREHANLLIVELGALLHDIADSKFHGGDETLGPAIAAKFLSDNGVEEETIIHVQNIIANISFKGGKEA